MTNGLVNVRPLERITLVGNSANFLSASANSSTVILCFLLMIRWHKLAILTSIFIGLGLYLHIESLEKPSGRPKRCIKRLHNTRMRDKQIGSSHNLLGYVRSMMQHLTGSVLAGKRLYTYILLCTHFYATRMFYMSKYMVNLGLGDNYQVLINRIYLYIYVIYHLWVSCKGATPFTQILTKSYTLVYFVSNLITLVIKSHEKYQSNLLDRLGHAERANGEKRSILGHNRSYWRELRHLVTPWAFCIKEGTEPWKNQTRSLTSHVQLQHHALGASEVRSLSLLALLSLDLWTLSGEICIGCWRQLPVALVPPQAGWPQRHLFRFLRHLWLEAPRTAPPQECKGPRASDGISARHPAALENRV